MIRRTLLSLILLISSLALSAQYGAFRLNIPSLFLRNLSGSAELGMNEKMSLNLGASYMIPYKNVKVDAGLAGFRSANSGFSLTPELRFYIAGNQTEGSGLYIGPYMRYARYKAGFEGKYFDSTLNADAFVNVETSLSEFGIGAQFGYQFLIKDRFVIDFFFFGPRISKYNFIAYAGADIGETEFFDALGIPNLDNSGFFGIGRYDFSISGNEATFRMPLMFVASRLGLSLGFKL